MHIGNENPNYLKAINKAFLFSKFSEEQLIKYLNQIQYSTLTYKKGEVVFSEDELCKNLSVILNGSVEIQKIDASGKVLTIAHFESGDIFGELLIFGDVNRFPMNVIAKEDTKLMHISKSSILKLCQLNMDFLYEYLRIISNKAQVLSSKLKEVTLKTIRQKICEFLLYEYSVQGKKEIYLNMTKKVWAEKMGVQRPSLSRELIKMKEEGFIDFDKESVTIIDLEGLE
jgi:CRP/FNR family transcriptional regulator, dissimilatory nitrate respiration regulator